MTKRPRSSGLEPMTLGNMREKLRRAFAIFCR
jgi:hypothetical protein